MLEMQPIWDVLRMKPAASASNQLAGVTISALPSAQVHRAAAQAAALAGALLVTPENVLVRRRVVVTPGSALVCEILLLQCLRQL